MVKLSPDNVARLLTMLDNSLSPNQRIALHEAVREGQVRSRLSVTPNGHAPATLAGLVKRELLVPAGERRFLPTSLACAYVEWRLL